MYACVCSGCGVENLAAVGCLCQAIAAVYRVDLFWLVDGAELMLLLENWEPVMWLNSLLTIYVHAVLDADPDVAGGVPVCWSLLVQPEDETRVLMILVLQHYGAK
ncbi:hypothetical protein Nepgr_022937 [Nepenthes gracilis]|uniref:Uncharacterized protein n=1 Tax=Nepenthes gracilis TaxID=150966 RepID=A0AAD3T0D3_NEPGR|nr:hypothetical protein Nepgr_022937 [Nepenthes gracilis]